MSRLYHHPDFDAAVAIERRAGGRGALVSVRELQPELGPELSWWWTTAPEAYDYSYVATVARAEDECAAWRLLAVTDRLRFEACQEPRYHSGLHACVEADTDEALARGLPRRAELEGGQC